MQRWIFLPLFLLHMPLMLSAQEGSEEQTGPAYSMSVLAAGIDSLPVMHQGELVWMLHPGEIFLYHTYSKTAWLSDGRFGVLEADHILAVDTPMFKMNFERWKFPCDDCAELTKSAQRRNVDMGGLLVAASANKDRSAYLQFFHLHNDLDGIAAEEFAMQFWALTNRWTDGELSSLLTSLKGNTRAELKTYLRYQAPLDKVEDYYRMYYPLTLAVLVSE